MRQYEARLRPHVEPEADESFDLSEADTSFDPDATWQGDVSFSDFSTKLGLVKNLNVRDPTQTATVNTSEQELEMYCRLDYLSAEGLRGISILDFWNVSESLQ